MKAETRKAKAAAILVVKIKFAPKKHFVPYSYCTHCKQCECDNRPEREFRQTEASKKSEGCICKNCALRVRPLGFG